MTNLRADAQTSHMARKRSDRRKGESSTFAPVFSNIQTLGSLKLRRTATIEMLDAEQRLRKGMARRVYERVSPDGQQVSVVFLDVTDFALDVRAADGLNFLGYQLCSAPVSVLGKPSPMFLTRVQMDLIAGQAFARGKSKTVRFGANEALRKAYADTQAKVTGRQMPLEDAIEVATVKLSGLHPGFALVDRMATPRV